MQKFNSIVSKFTVAKEELELDEVLNSSDPTGKWIHDFVHSDNPKFAGKSKKERINMALGAAYGAKKKNEELEIDISVLENISEKLGLEIIVENTHYENAEKARSEAMKAKSSGDEKAYHLHMAGHHDHLIQWHESKGRSAIADSHYTKMNDHIKKAGLSVEEGVDEASSASIRMYKALQKAKEQREREERLGDELLNKKPPEQKPVQKEEKDICSNCQRDPCECDDSHGFVYEESDDKGEYDYEGDMAMSDLRSIIYNAQQLHDMMEDDTNLPEWLQAKITKAEDYISSAANYMRSEMNEEVVAEETHRIGLTVTDPNHPMVSKRDETYHKTVRATGDKEKAIKSAIAHYRKKGYKVHDHHYIGTVNEAIGRRGDAYTRDYQSSTSGMGHKDSFAYQQDGGANDEGWGRETKSKPADHPHAVHINGKKWKTFGSQSHASNVAKKIKGATVHKEEVEQVDEITKQAAIAQYKNIGNISTLRTKNKVKPEANFEKEFIKVTKGRPFKFKVKEEADQIGEMIGPNAAVMTPSQYDAYRLSLKNLKTKSKEKKEPSKEELAKKWQKYN